MRSRFVTILLLLLVILLLVAAVPFQRKAVETRAHKTLEDLEKGMTVMVTFDPQSASDSIRRATAVVELIVSEDLPGPNQVRGHLKSIDLAQGRIVITAQPFRKAPEDLTFSITDDTGIGIGAGPELTQLSDLGAATILLMGGFRGLAVDVLWLRSIALHEDRRYHEERALLDIISNLQPRYASVWVFQAWNISYNISVQYDSPEEQYKWVREGRDFLLKGEKILPESADVAFWLGIIYEHKYSANPVFGELLEKEEGKNNFEEAAYWFDRSRRLIAEGHPLSVFHPRVADSQVFHCIESRYQQALQQASVGPEGFSRQSLDAAEPWRQRALAEARGLNKRWSDDTVFPGFQTRVDTVPVEAYIFHAGKTLIDGNLSLDAETRARVFLDLARRELAAVASRNTGKEAQTVIAYSAARIETCFLDVYLTRAAEVISGQAHPPQGPVREAVNWLKRTRTLMETARLDENRRLVMTGDIDALLTRAKEILETGPAVGTEGK